jgi:hypothetical protein
MGAGLDGLDTKPLKLVLICWLLFCLSNILFEGDPKVTLGGPAKFLAV